MITLNALLDGQEKSLDCMGALCPIEAQQGMAVRLRKKIVLPGMGSYRKVLTTPLYSAKDLRQYALAHSDWSFAPTSCLGVLCTTLQVRPDGYVTRQSGVHRFCLPLYQSDRLSAVFYHVAGYMVTEGGFVAVACRRTLLWVLLGLLAATTFVLSYLAFSYGMQGAGEELIRFWKELC
ncbi:MAG: hypothetical protein RR185_06705 [Angelakisella sp.]